MKTSVKSIIRDNLFFTSMMLVWAVILAIVMMVVGCGSSDPQGLSDETLKKNRDSESGEQKNISEAVLQLQGQLSALVSSDFATCNGGAITEALVKRICDIAQAATVEARTEMKNNLADLATNLGARITGTQNDFKVLEAQWVKLYGVAFPQTTGGATPTLADCAANNATASVIECMKVTGGALGSLATIANATTTTVDVGSENVLAGPVYETLLRFNDKSRINAYKDGHDTPLTVAADPMTTTNASATVAVASTAHGLANGDVVQLSGCSSGNGLTSKDLYGLFAVSGSAANTFNITVGVAATGSGTIGGSACVIRKSTGSGLSSIWTSAAASDAAVRTTNIGSKAYNFAICKTGAAGWVCYDKTDATATFGTISAGWNTSGACQGDAANIVCK